MSKRQFHAGLFCVLVGLCGSTGCQQWQLEVIDGNLAVESGQRPVLTYRSVAVPFKPYVRSLCTPQGVNVLRDAPHDHLHHHGLMYALTIDDVNFWEEAKTSGQQVPQKTDDVYAAMKSAAERFVPRTGWQGLAMEQMLDWRKPAGQATLMLERRRLEVYTGSGLDATLITWQSTLSTPPGVESTEITGRHYFGLGMRFVESMDKGGQFFNADGGTGVQGTNDIRSRWCAYTAIAKEQPEAADGHPVTVAIFDHPSNPRHPATWFTMTEFAYMSATPDVHHQPLTLQARQPMRWRFGVALWDGHMQADRIEALYQQWAGFNGKD